MLGAIIGDLAGSIYEYDQVKKIINIKINNLIEDNSFISDDTILTIAIMDAILSNSPYENKLKEYGKRYINKVPNNIPYFQKMFSPGFEKWLNGNSTGTSIGNGAMMRISPIGYMFDNEQEILDNVAKATIPSHNTKEAIESAQIVALIIFYARKGLKKEDIIKKLNLDIKYQPFIKFNYTCSDTITNCLYALFTSNSFDESIRKVISFGGDTDTNACIVGSMAEAIFGIDKELITKAKSKLPNEFLTIIDSAYTHMESNHTL